MTASVRNRTQPFTYLPGGSVAVREDDLLSLRWGCKSDSAHQRKLKLVAALVDVIEVRRQIGALDSLAAYLQPIETALAAVAQTDAQHREATTDAEEDIAQEAVRCEPCERTVRNLLRVRACMRAAALDDDRRLAADWGIAL